MATRTKRRPTSKTAITLRQYQRQVEATDESKHTLVSLLGLVGELGDIQTVVKRRLEQGGYPYFRTDMAEELGDTLWYLASLASRFKLSLNEIATRNIEKAKQFHSPGITSSFDRTYPKDERLPRQFDVVFEEKPIGRRVQVKIMQNGVFVGDALTDNAHVDDGYRYHDAFHLAYVAILGWSPVIRDLLRRKRKSNRKVDEVEDGARAKIVEEAISIFLFNQSRTRNEFKELKSIDISLLKVVKRLASSLEVKDCTAKQWQMAIFKGYEIFRKLRDNRGGTISLDLDQATITYRPHHSRSTQRVKNGGNPPGKLSKRMARRREVNSPKSS